MMSVASLVSFQPVVGMTALMHNRFNVDRVIVQSIVIDGAGSDQTGRVECP
jgi:hypothetical protein